jgi:thiamine biosynthesis lipoprotein
MPFDIGGEQPPSDLVIALHGSAVATSGDYRRYVLHDGRRYSHTIDPRTGAPVTSAVASVTVIHPSCMCADALATALMAMEPQRALEFSERFRVAARILVRGPRDFEEILTPVFRSYLEV